MLGLGTDRDVRRNRQSRRLRLARTHAARPRHHGGMRPTQERERQAARQRAPRRDALRRTGANAVLAPHANFIFGSSSILRQAHPSASSSFDKLRMRGVLFFLILSLEGGELGGAFSLSCDKCL